MTAAVKLGKSWGSLALGLIAAGAIACSGEEAVEAATQSPSPAASATPRAAPGGGVDAVAEAEQVFVSRCVTCHGPSGGGDGPGSQALTPSPRNFQDPAWQDEVDDDHIANIVMYGGSAVGRSPSMPGNPDLAGKPEVIEALVAYVRGLRSD